MALATRCPNCNALFRVGAEQLKSRGGMVRCGSCRHVFNAIGCLDYVDPGTAAPVRPPQAARETPTAETHAPVLPDKARARQPTAKRTARGLPAEHRSAGRPARTPGKESVPSQADRDADPQAPGSGAGEHAAAQTAPQAASEHHAGASFEQLFAFSAPDEKSEGEPIGSAHEAVDDSLADEPPPEVEPAFLRVEREPVGRVGRLALGIACALLVPCLATALALLFRADLIVHYPELRPALAALCQPLSCTAQWPMRPEFLAVVSSDLQAVPGTDALELDAVIRNRAGFAMALPAIELTVTDSLNRPVARRVFLPEEFVAVPPEAAAAAVESIAPGADLSVRVLFELPGLNAAGFVAYPFYP